MIGPPITANSANITTNDHLISDFFIESPPIILVKIALKNVLPFGRAFVLVSTPPKFTTHNSIIFYNSTFCCGRQEVSKCVQSLVGSCISTDL